MSVSLATMAARMRFGRSMDRAVPGVDRRETGRTFPADEIVWGIVVRPGFDELYDPLYHRGTTQHAYLEGNDIVSLCGFRPPRTGPRSRRRSRLGLPTPGIHPMCGMCARKVVAPRPRVAVPVGPGRPSVAVPVTPVPAITAVSASVRSAAAVAPGMRPAVVAKDLVSGNGHHPAPQHPAASRTMSGPMPATPPHQANTPQPRGPAPAMAPWVRRAVDSSTSATSSHGLLERGVHADLED